MLSGMLKLFPAPISTIPEGSSTRCNKYILASIFLPIWAAIFTAYLDFLEKSTGTKILYIVKLFY